ncbi:MAG: hypothetical protein J0J01_23270 [Reyranella sp.]|uniref:hypothetical protein n=1 Tax=Reyranella sp. TaxID=1929291 RepID=UPI001AC53533|nr:hypothetical protein [Reyranella sp.]MBN9089844.1 hypothetical protein [Reyranella sp.]
MPFTPFHLGPGAVFKAIGGRHFSFMIFGGSQVLIDLEPLVHMVRGDPVLHGPAHTFVGALGVAVVAAVVGRPASAFVLRRLGARDASIGWTVAGVSALVGTWSHVVLDGLIHRDMHPLWPLATGNPLLGLVYVETLYQACLACGVIGAAAIALRAAARHRIHRRSGAD